MEQKARTTLFLKENQRHRLGLAEGARQEQVERTRGGLPVRLRESSQPGPWWCLLGRLGSRVGWSWPL